MLECSRDEVRFDHETHRTLKNSMSKYLLAREERVIRLRFGLVDGHQKSFGDIGSHMAVSAERVRQIECKALRKLRTVMTGERAGIRSWASAAYPKVKKQVKKQKRYQPPPNCAAPYSNFSPEVWPADSHLAGDIGPLFNEVMPDLDFERPVFPSPYGHKRSRWLVLRDGDYKTISWSS